tara:strand:+ start:182 stop:763 length:582 start_codon:yes stop_codon:yes gene_type:complete
MTTATKLTAAAIAVRPATIVIATAIINAFKWDVVGSNSQFIGIAPSDAFLKLTKPKRDKLTEKLFKWLTSTETTTRHGGTAGTMEQQWSNKLWIPVATGNESLAVERTIEFVNENGCMNEALKAANKSLIGNAFTNDNKSRWATMRNAAGSFMRANKVEMKCIIPVARTMTPLGSGGNGDAKVIPAGESMPTE